MAVFWETIPEHIIEWILKQKLFFIASAPLAASGHINVSPKGGQYFGVIDERTFWYMDLTGSGNETISHLLEPGNGRVVVMFSAFESAPRILRLWGHGRVLENGTEAFTDFISEHNVETIPGTRSIIIVDVHQVGGSCGYSVPFFEFKEYRTTLNDRFAKKEKRYNDGVEKESMDRYWAYKNAWSMDALPGMQRGIDAGKKHAVSPIKKMVGPLAPTRYHTGSSFAIWQVLIIALASFLLGLALAVFGAQHLSGSLNGARVGLLEEKVLNMTHVQTLEGFSHLWSAG